VVTRAAIAAVVAWSLVGCSSGGKHLSRTGVTTGPRAQSSAAAGSVQLVWRHRPLGSSVRGRPIVAYKLGNAGASERVLVVGCIHGTECAGIPIAWKLVRGSLPREFELLVIPNLNPDGFHLHTRQNARGVDLNRNFPYHWVHEGYPGSTFYSGPRPLSEPESRIARRYVLYHRPDITFWFHQHMNLVWASGGNFGLQRCFARLAGIRFRRLPAISGSANNWINHTLIGQTSTVVELPGGTLSGRQVTRFAHAVRVLGRWDAGRPDDGPCPA
jgi:protein MpaA